MAKGQTHIEGIYPQWRKGEGFDSLRVAVRPSNGKQIQLSAKTHTLLGQINRYLKNKKFHRIHAETDSHFINLRDSLFNDLKAEYGLKAYRIKEKLDLKSKLFDFEESIKSFGEYKANHSVGRSYESTMRYFWLPLFYKKFGCEHPREFLVYKLQAKNHVRTSKNKFGRPYSPNTYTTLTTPFNEYMRFCEDTGVIKPEESFSIDAELTLEEKKRRRVAPVRSTRTYTLPELFEIKKKIDVQYKENPEWKLKAYAMLFGVYTGLRRGNLLGLYASNLYPESNPPHFQLKDNIVSGWSRGEKGAIVIEDATKTSHDENVKIPFIQPDRDTIVEVAQYLKDNLKPTDRLITCAPDTILKWWKKISQECKFPYVHPHGWRHSYATLGAMNLKKWYKGIPFLLQKCCLHSSYRTTEKYIQGTSDELLTAFEDEGDASSG